MLFRHAAEIWDAFPGLTAGVAVADGIGHDVDAGDVVRSYHQLAEKRLREKSISEFPEIRAWRGAFSAMGLKPTQYRCASEALLRRFNKEHGLPSLHPLVDLCNAVSLRYAIPIAVFDLAEVAEYLVVRRADGTEEYRTFAGGIERPEPGEIVFADALGRAHARRWTNRQSAQSAVRPSTRSVLIVAEALHPGAATDVADLLDSVSGEVGALWGVPVRTVVPTASSPEVVLP